MAKQEARSNFNAGAAKPCKPAFLRMWPGKANNALMIYRQRNWSNRKCGLFNSPFSYLYDRCLVNNL
jgi:hypothetical protein